MQGKSILDPQQKKKYLRKCLKNLENNFNNIFSLTESKVKFPHR